MADLTQTQGQTMDWTLLDDIASATPHLETSEIDTVDSVGVILHIDVAHIDAEAADSVLVKVWIKTGTTDEDWSLLIEFQSTSGTATVGDIDQSSAAAQVNVYVVDTGSCETVGKVFFCKDVGDLTASQLAVVSDWVTDDYIICIDNLVNTYATDDETYDIVDQWNVAISNTIQACRVTFHNSDATATHACRVRYTMATDIE